jgi:DNA-binding NarL/FixJ family response regulator
MYNITQLWYNYIVNVFGRIEVFMKENINKQLSLSQRTRIEEMLNQRKRKYEIANELDKTQSTILKYFNQYLAKTEIEILELVIIVQN